jgi:hypothetical protein
MLIGIIYFGYAQTACLVSPGRRLVVETFIETQDEFDIGVNIQREIR